MIDSASPGGLEVDRFRWIETGPVRAVAALDGHFLPSAGAGLCNLDGGDDYPRFGYTAILTFERARRGFGLELHLRNECSDAQGNDWTDQAVTVDRASW